jgi:nucleoside-diphosphate-sugar epimerase
MKTVMVTGGAGFFGGILKRAILESGDRCDQRGCLSG